MTIQIERLALRCWLGLGHLERRGSRGRPWLTLVRPGAEIHYLQRLGHALRLTAAPEKSEHYFDWIPGDGSEDVCRLRFHAPQLEPLLDLAPSERWAGGGAHALGALWLDRGLWNTHGRGGVIRVRTADSIDAALDALRRWGRLTAAQARRGGGGGDMPHGLIKVSEEGMQALVAAVRPQCPDPIRFTLRRWASRRRHGLMGLGRALGAKNSKDWAARLGFLP